MRRRDFLKKDFLKKMECGRRHFQTARIRSVSDCRWERWQWARNFWFRVANLLAIGLVAVNAWLGKICPLTIWENEMREAAGSDAYPGTFVGYYLQKVIYYDFPIWVFAIVYTVFVALVLVTWIIWPPLWSRCNSGKER